MVKVISHDSAPHSQTILIWEIGGGLLLARRAVLPVLRSDAALLRMS
jgi:hypothetical protein